ncbi:retron Ec67 family RNA-directed DNA polymerase/endonuclease [Pseudomonas asplenii]|uniref:retron Ec67 family RNA-directed DNA polymerase/endonuclease n=1 Tax=Pseudomonas asplenii TaxID=53407 RepID=UPI0006CE1872|nr:retron Ec67 family RNA-directed DNA polymerase/endonuclease [Pseudomonas fuscovaginae]KPA98212.1 Reverse transcriptase (RNA-dependent DNA polymerase) [Pseudomonas fuscovaginae]
MSDLRALQRATTLHDLAQLLNYEPKFLAYLIYKRPNKYSSFTIPKSSGAARNILAPCDELKALQKKVKVLLESCQNTIDLQNPLLGSLSHGFKPNHSIATNADVHKKRLYVFNIDIEGFFDSIHLGRIRGFLINNNSYKLQPKIATILAQIMCHNGTLPQGSPTSPFASNLIGHLIDIRMVALAARSGCTYSRYADDITFSTSKKNFPIQIAYCVDETNTWVPGSSVLNIISKCGFSLNHDKTRMQYTRSQQSVTGLVVNKITHTPADYRRTVRAMLHRLFLDGTYFTIKKPRHLNKSERINIPFGQLDKLEGMLSYIYMVDKYNRDKIVNNSRIKDEDIPLASIEKMHGDFLFYKYFYAGNVPTLVCEGKTDNVYLSCAMKSLSAKYPELIKVDKDGKKSLKARFINYSKLTHRLLNMFGGSADIAQFIRLYARRCKKYKAHPPLHPTIVVVDNDMGSKEIFGAIKDTTGDRYITGTGKARTLDKSRTLYYIAQNLYVVLTPLNSGKDTMMEDFFPKAVLTMQHKGKSFEILKGVKPGNTYSKHIFAQHIIKAHQKSIDFTGFAPIIDSIKAAILDYPKIKSTPP